LLIGQIGRGGMIIVAQALLQAGFEYSKALLKGPDLCCLLLDNRQQMDDQGLHCWTDTLEARSRIMLPRSTGCTHQSAWTSQLVRNQASAAHVSAARGLKQA
jgi:hypothetical protein